VLKRITLAPRGALAHALISPKLGISILLSVVLLLGATSGNAQQKVALVVGNSNYQHVQPQLNNPAHDADLIASKLSAQGFTLIGGGAQKDLSLSAFSNLIDQFSDEAAKGDVAIFYYSGHGIQLNGVNYLVPSDANPVNGATDVPKQMIDASFVLSTLDDAGSRLKILILDACEDNPFAPEGLADNGLADMSRLLADPGTVVWFATRPGEKAQDGVGPEGPFALAMSKYIDTPNLSIFDFFNKAGTDLLNTTAPPQQSWLVATPLDGTFYFDPTTSDGKPLAGMTKALFVEPVPDTVAVDRIKVLFSNGVHSPTRSFSLGESVGQINSKLDSPFGISGWGALPVAGEFPGEDVRYLWVGLPNLPIISSAIIPNSLQPGQCIDPQSYITFLFHQNKLVSISIRLFRSPQCSSYQWLFTYLFNGPQRSTVIHNGQYDVSVAAEDDPAFSIINVTEVGQL
jgi:hypothetical protein